MKRLLLFISALVLSFSAAWAQATVSGTVTDTETGDALEGVAVLVKGTTKGMFTDASGNYSLDVPAGGEILVFTFVGKSKQEVPINGQSVINVGMAPEDVELQEVVVTAFGVSKEKRTLGYAVQEIGGDELLRAQEVNVTNALNARVAGVQVVSSSGAPGGSANIRIRGSSSINGDNSPLFVIDGLPIDNSESATQARTAGVANSNRLIDLNSADIEDMTVLKGLAATSLYGIRGANGVILITTKKGSSTAKSWPDISYSFSARIDQTNKMPELQKDWVQGRRGDMRDGTGYGWSWGAKKDTLFRTGNDDFAWDKGGNLIGAADAASGAYPNSTKFNPYDNINNFYVDGQVFEHNLSIGGGGPDGNYRVSIGQLNQTGIIPNSTFNRTSVKINGGMQVAKRLRVSGQATYIASGGNRIQQGSNLSGTNLGLFRTPINFDNSNGFGDDAVNQMSSYQFLAGNPYGMTPGRQRNYRASGGYDNPYWISNLTPYKDVVNRFIASTQIDYNVTDWLDITYRIGIDAYSDDRRGGFEKGSRTTPGGQAFRDIITSRDINSDLLITYHQDFGSDFNLNVTVGHNYYAREFVNTYVQGDALAFQGFIELSNASAISTSDFRSKRYLSGVFLNASASWKSQLYLTVTARQDWASTLSQVGSNNTFFYPSAALGWVFTETFGMRESKGFSYGKLRVSYAEAANDARPYATETNFSTGVAGDGWTTRFASPFNGLLGYQQSAVLGDPKLKPERSTEFELGLDLRFLSNRIGVDFTYYNRQSKDVIFPILISSASGFSNISTNAGVISNKGIEVVLTADVIKTKDITWNFTFNFTRNVNTVESLAEGIEDVFLAGFTSVSSRAIAGQPYGAIYGGRWLRDGQGRRVINPNDGYPIVDSENGFLGDPNPNFLLGISTYFNWKGLWVSALLDIRDGSMMWNGTDGALSFVGTSARTNNREDSIVFDGVIGQQNADLNWEGTDEVNTQTVALDQGWYQGNGGGFGDQGEDFMQKTNWVRLREVSLGYSIPRSALGNGAIQGIDISVSGRNLILSTPYTGVDPETNLTGASNGVGLEYFNMPNTKSYTVNVGIRF